MIIQDFIIKVLDKKEKYVKVTWHVTFISTHVSVCMIHLLKDLLGTCVLLYGINSKVQFLPFYFPTLHEGMKGTTCSEEWPGRFGWHERSSFVLGKLPKPLIGSLRVASKNVKKPENTSSD